MKTVGNVLVVAGAVVGIGTVTAIATGYEVHLTPDMVQLLIYKALGAAAVGLMIVGTWIGRGGSDKGVNASENVDPQHENVPTTPRHPALGSESAAGIDGYAGQHRDPAMENVAKAPKYRSDLER